MENDKIKLVGEVTTFQTDLDNNEIPGTREVHKNSIGTALKQYLANAIAADVDKAINSFFATSGTLSAADDGDDGITSGISITNHTHKFVTTLNSGGDGTEVYVEFYGYIEGAVTLNPYLYLGSDYADASTKLNNLFAARNIGSITVSADRKYHVYWKITLS